MNFVFRLWSGTSTWLADTLDRERLVVIMVVVVMMVGCGGDHDEWVLMTVGGDFLRIWEVKVLTVFFRSFSSLIYQQAKTTRSARFDQTFICTIVLLMQNMTILYYLYNDYMILITIMIVMNGKDYDVAVFWCWQPLPRRLWGRVRRQLLLP